MRKLASIRNIDSIDPIPDADAIEVATVGGWKVVVKKGEFTVDQAAIYCEIDSWIPLEIAPFLQKGDRTHEFEGVTGNRLRTIRLRGQLSQGLLLPYTKFPAVVHAFHQTRPASDEPLDVTELLGIRKWEPVIPAQLAGEVKGLFPSQIPKTDQERCQNLVEEIVSANEAGSKFEITEKLEGSSMTCYLIDGEFGVCSRNLDLKRNPDNSLWATAIADDVEGKMREVGDNFALQGELIGPGIQNNIYKLSKTEFRVFDVYSIVEGRYLNPAERRGLIEMMSLKHVPVLVASGSLYDTLGITDIPQLLKYAEGKSSLTSTVEREGVVFKQTQGGMTFKAISNKYLLGEK
jgi:RNA ligase (TIGR02306 family)